MWSLWYFLNLFLKFLFNFYILLSLFFLSFLNWVGLKKTLKIVMVYISIY